MCGRFTRSSPPTAIAEELGVEVDPAFAAAPRFNVCPSENVLVLARGSVTPTLDPLRPAPGGTRPALGASRATLGWMRWGLVPWFARDAKSGPRSINARAETLATNRVFREAFERRRCLIVADGFYEWRAAENPQDKVPHFIRLRSRRPFVFAGVWERWKAKDGEALLSCAIVTCAANPLVAPIHDRMPVIVPPSAREQWIAADHTGADVAPLLQPYPADEMEAYPVSRLVNAPRNDVAECMQRHDPPDA